MPSTLRMKRINDRIKEILSLVLLTKIDDPRLLGITVTDVKVDRELDYANIYVSAIEGQERAGEILEALKRARGFLRYEVSQELDLRVTPRLRFLWDPTPERADRIDNLLLEWQNEEHPKFDDDETETGDSELETEEEDFDDDGFEDKV